MLCFACTAACSALLAVAQGTYSAEGTASEIGFPELTEAVI